VVIEIVETGPQPDLVNSLLRALPAWFGIEDSIREYVEAAHRLPTVVARTHDGLCVGVLLYEWHFPESAEIHLMASIRDTTGLA
jgi:hypothetical protein